MSIEEQVHVFSPRQMVGVLSLPSGGEWADAGEPPASAPPKTVLIVIVGGPQYRAGSHRQFVQLCRAAADGGHAAFRFDATGMGDSAGELSNFLSMSNDIAAAIEFVQQQLPSAENIVLWGLCDGASAALLYWHERRDPRVKGLCLLNPWVRSAASQAQTQVKHYYTQRLRQGAFWRKLLTGRVAAGAVAELLRSLRTMLSSGKKAEANRTDHQPFQTCMAQAWQAFPGPILLLLSGDDFTAKEFVDTLNQDAAWKNALKHPQLQRHDLALADHTFSGNEARLAVEKITSAWMANLQSSNTTKPALLTDRETP